MREDKAVSVIVVTYNQASTIRRTLDSILAQATDVPYEIVIGDDGSTDGTDEICREYAEKYPDRITYLRRERNIGVTANYFDCIANARGRYLADCAGDDYWVDPGKLQRQYDVLESRPDVAMAASDWLCRDEATGELSRAGNECRPGEYEGKSILAALLVNEKVLHLCSALFRKDVIEKMVREHPEVMTEPDSPCEDLQIELACAAAGRIVVLPEITLHYSVGHESVSHRKSFFDKYNYTKKSVKHSLKLQEFFLNRPDASEKKKLRKFYKKKGDYLAAMAFKSGYLLDFSNNGFESEIADSLNLPFGIKGKFYRYMMRRPALWQAAMRLIRHDLPQIGQSRGS